MRQVLAVAVVAAATLSGTAEAAEPRPIEIAVDASAEVEPWRAAALRRLLALEAGGDHRLEVVDGDAPAELTLAGTIAADHMDLRLEGGERPAAARITITGTDRTALRHALRTMLDHGLSAAAAHELDHRPARVAAADAGIAALLAVWLAIVAVLALPFAAGLWLLGRGGARRIAATRSFRYALGIAAAALAALVGIAAGADALPRAGPTLYIAGGLTWGVFAVSTLRVVFPAFPGFERVEHGDVFRLARAWSLVALLRLVRTMAFYAPFGAALWLVCALLEVPAAPAIALLVPLWGLVARFWLLALVDVASLYLDGELIAGQANDDDPWHQAVRGYFMGYVRRAGWPADDSLLDDVLFLPGAGDELVSYGGGLTGARVVISRRTLESALAPYGRPHDYAGPRISKLHWSEWNAGLVVPVEIKGTLATPEQRQPMYATVPGETEWERLGEPPTLAGIVEPAQFDKRDHYRPHDDPLWLDWDPGDEHDGTDASDKDFVFGALVHELGAIRRGDTQLGALGLALRRRLAGGPGWARAATARVAGWLDRGLSRYPAIVGDAYAALNFARHHLVQYLAWREWGDDELLTARAHAPELEQMSGRILRKLDAAGAGAGAVTCATTRNRLTWLSVFFREPIHSRGTVIARRVVLAGALVAVAAVTAVGIARAVDYHPTYVERIEQQKHELRGSQHEQAD